MNYPILNIYIILSYYGIKIAIILLKIYFGANNTMQFLEALKLKSKLFFLFVLITIGLIAVGIMGTVNFNAMKKNMDSLYFGSFVPVTELNEILEVYHGELATIIYKAKHLKVNKNEVALNIENSLIKIDKYWESYQSHFKRDEELQYVDYVASEIKNTNNYFLRILAVTKGKKNLGNISIDLLESHVEHIHNIMKKLINYEVDIAKYERKVFLDKYNSTFKELSFILMLIIFAVLVISYNVFKSIQGDHTKLESTTKKLKIANKKLENVSYTDSLTNLHNRRYFNFVYERELRRAKRTKSYITFMMLDIDYFKQYNDTYGHIQGDYALKSVATVLKETLKRPSDFVFRLGGEEFGILFIDVDEENSAKLAQKLCDAIRDKEIKHENSKVNKYLTVSIGVICCKISDSIDENILITCADNMLYKAKNDGRDRCVLSTEVADVCVEYVAS